MVKIYDGDGAFANQIGECRDGTVYRGTGMTKTAIGLYENGKVYSGTGMTKTIVGEYDSRRIYKRGFFNETVGEFKGGAVYKSTNFFKNRVGKYSSDNGAHAAAFMMFPGCYTKEETSDTEGFLLLDILTFLVHAVIAVAMGAWWFYYKFLSFLGSLPLILLFTSVAPVGMVAVAIPPIAVFMGISSLIYIPTLITMIVFRVQKKITTNNMRTTGALWCVIGALALIYLIIAMKNHKKAQADSVNL